MQGERRKGSGRRSPVWPLTKSLFSHQVRDQVEGYLQGGGSSTKVILMPSLRCVQHHPVYPQPPMEV